MTRNDRMMDLAKNICDGFAMASLHLAMERNSCILIRIHKSTDKCQDWFLTHDSNNNYYLSVERCILHSNESKIHIFSEWKNTENRAKMLCIFARILEKECKRNKDVLHKVYGHIVKTKVGDSPVIHIY